MMKWTTRLDATMKTQQTDREKNSTRIKRTFAMAMTCAAFVTLLSVFAACFFPLNISSTVSETTTTRNNGTEETSPQQQQQQRWQPFQVEIDEYIRLSAQRGHAGAVRSSPRSSPRSWEYPALSAESLGRALRNKTIYVDGESFCYYLAVLLLHCLDYLCENGLDGKNPTPPLTNVKSMLLEDDTNEPMSLRSGRKEHYANLWGNGRNRFDRCFLHRGEKEKNFEGDENATTTKEEETTSSPYVTVLHSFYYNQRDSAEDSILLPSRSTPPPPPPAAGASSNNNNFNNKVATTTIDVAVLDFAAMHRLHLFPVKNGWNTDKVLENIGPSLRFRNQIERTVKLASEAGAKCVFLRTPNPICESKDVGPYRLAREFYRNLEELDRCGGGNSVSHRDDDDGSNGSNGNDNNSNGNGTVALLFDEEGCRRRIDAWESGIPDVIESSLGVLRKTDLCNVTRLRSKRFELETRCVETITSKLRKLNSSSSQSSLEEEEEEEETTANTNDDGGGGNEKKEFYNYGNDDDVENKTIRKLCSYRFSQTNMGVESRRDQIRRFVLANQERYYRRREEKKKSSTKLIYFDWYRIVRDYDYDYCRYTEDSVHYGNLLPLQLKLITNIIARHCVPEF